MLTRKKHLLPHNVKLIWTCIVISVSWLTSMPERQRRQKEFFTIPENRTKLGKFTREVQQWTGWNKNRSLGLPSLLLPQRVLGRTIESTSSILLVMSISL